MFQFTIGRFSVVLDGRYASLALGSRKVELAVEPLRTDAPLFDRVTVTRRAFRHYRHTAAVCKSFDAVLFRRQFLLDLIRERSREPRPAALAA